MSILDQLKALCAARDNRHSGISENGEFIFLAANLDYPRLIAMVERYEAALQKIANRPDLPNPERDADWKNCMKWSAHEALEALAKETP